MAYKSIHPGHGAITFTRTPEEIRTLELEKGYEDLKRDNEELRKKQKELEDKINRMVGGE